MRHIMLILALTFTLARTAAAQLTDTVRSARAITAAVRTAASDLDSLEARALLVNPTIRAAEARISAARRRERAAGARPDPMLTAGIENQSLGREKTTLSAHGEAPAGGPDPMTMRTLGVGQTIPFPGKLSLRTRVSQRETAAARAALDGAKRTAVRDVRSAYYELSFLDQAYAVATRSAEVLGTFIQVTQSRYGAGVAGQHDVLKARVEAARLAETAASIQPQRLAALARLNAALDRPSDTPVPSPAIPPGIVRAAIGDSARVVRFATAALGAPLADSPLPSVAELQEIAAHQNPEIREHEAMIAAQTARVELARKDALPDVDVSLQYGFRPGLTDMLTATVSVPIPLQRRRKQDQLVGAASDELAALNDEHRAKLNALNADIASRAADLQRERTQLALYVKAILPQERAALASATASYQSGKVEFLTVLDSQSTLFGYETDYFRALADFAKNLAELERLVGQEVVR